MPTPMDPTSTGFLFAENRSQPMHVGGLQLFRKPEGAGRTFVKDMFDEMLTHDHPAPLFRKRPHRSVSHGRAVVLDRGPAVRHRVPRPAQRAPQARAGSASCSSCAAGCTAPGWPSSGRCGRCTSSRGCATAGSAIYSKMHHALIDGVSSMRLMQRVLSTDPDERGMAPIWSAEHVPPPTPRW